MGPLGNTRSVSKGLSNSTVVLFKGAMRHKFVLLRSHSRLQKYVIILCTIKSRVSVDGSA